MKTIYEKHSTAFSNVSAYCMVDNNQRFIGNIAFKFPKDGAGRLQCFLHFHGEKMAQGIAGGYGYDKIGASFENAVENYISQQGNNNVPTGIDACMDIEGLDFQTALRKIGIHCYSAV